MIADILASLPSLTQEDLAKVGVAVAGLKATTKVKFDTGNDWLLRGIIRELESRGQAGLIPSSFTISGLKSFRGYAKQSLNVRSWIVEQIKHKLSKNEFLYLGDLAAGCLGDLIVAWEHPVTLHMMLNNVGRIPEAIMRQFPGYIEAGVLSWVMKNRKQTS